MRPTRIWSAEEDALLKSLVGEQTSMQIAKRIGCTYEAVSRRRKLLGLRVRAGSFTGKWDDADMQVLREGAALRLGAQEIGRRLRRTTKSVYRRASMVGIPLTNHPWYTPEQETTIREAAGVLTLKQLAAKLGRSRGGLEYKIKQMGVVLLPEGNTRPWSEEDIAMLRECLQSGMDAAAIGRQLKRSRAVIYNKVFKLGLARKMRPRYSAEEERAIREAEGKLTIKELATQLGRSYRALERKVNAMGVKLRRAAGSGSGWGNRDANVARREKGLPRVATGAAARNVTRQKSVAAGPVKRLQVETISRLVYCPSCGAPVVNTARALAGHQERVHPKPAVKFLGLDMAGRCDIAVPWQRRA